MVDESLPGQWFQEATGHSLEQRAKLFGKLTAIAAKAGLISATGKNQFDKKAISIYDVENNLRQLFVDHRVLTIWVSRTSKADEKLWIAEMEVELIDSETGYGESFHWQDIGNNPMAATSFARKGFYKALFHLAEEGEDAVKHKDAGPTQSSGSAEPTKKSPCPYCKEHGYKMKSGGQPYYWPSASTGELVCNGLNAEGQPARHSPQVEAFNDPSAIPF